MSSSDRLKKLFGDYHNNDQKLLSLFLTAGFPEINETVDLVVKMGEAGADMVELGMPFSDPLADGPTIQSSSEVALKNGITLAQILKMVEEIRKVSQIPIILMGYLNPVMHYGIEKFCKNASQAGADALILPDVPIEESGMIESYIKESGLKLIYLVAPNTSDERMKLIDDRSEGFVYCVSVTGVTGTRSGDEVAQSVDRFIDRVNRNITKNPVMVGFGIKNHDDALKIAAKADGYIVGSALIDEIKRNYPNPNWKDNVLNFVHQLKYGK